MSFPSITVDSDPNGVVSAPVGSIFIRNGSTFYMQNPDGKVIRLLAKYKPKQYNTRFYQNATVTYKTENEIWEKTEGGSGNTGWSVVIRKNIFFDATTIVNPPPLFISTEGTGVIFVWACTGPVDNPTRRYVVATGLEWWPQPLDVRNIQNKNLFIDTSVTLLFTFLADGDFFETSYSVDYVDNEVGSSSLVELTNIPVEPTPGPTSSFSPTPPPPGPPGYTTTWVDGINYGTAIKIDNFLSFGGIIVIKKTV